MTDREMLELAAKAAGGIEFVRGCGWISTSPAGSRGAWWNPLADDGDALRLAVKLKLDVLQHGDGEGCYAGTHTLEQGAAVYFGNHDGDEFSANRRAIVRAAAEIGKAMK